MWLEAFQRPVIVSDLCVLNVFGVNLEWDFHFVSSKTNLVHEHQSCSATWKQKQNTRTHTHKKGCLYKLFQNCSVAQNPFVKWIYQNELYWVKSIAFEVDGKAPADVDESRIGPAMITYGKSKSRIEKRWRSTLHKYRNSLSVILLMTPVCFSRSRMAQLQGKCHLNHCTKF